MKVESVLFHISFMFISSLISPSTFQVSLSFGYFLPFLSLKLKLKNKKQKQNPSFQSPTPAIYTYWYVSMAGVVWTLVEDFEVWIGVGFLFSHSSWIKESQRKGDVEGREIWGTRNITEELGKVDSIFSLVWGLIFTFIIV